MTSDRVSQLYYGQIMAEETQEACRQRIRWMCSQAVGQDVLDVGCSEGIASILLGRDGFQVKGIDVDAAAIDYARKDLDRQTANVKKNVSFEATSLDELELADESFDSILLGEILEHQTQPQRMLRTAHRLLRPDGRVIITVPFGVHPHPDHVQTFYISNFIALLAPFFAVDQLCVLDRYICATATRKPPSGGGKPSIADDAGHLLRISENAFHFIEEKQDQRRDAAAKRIERLQSDLNAARGANKQTTRIFRTVARDLLALCEDIAQRTNGSDRSDNAITEDSQLISAIAEAEEAVQQFLAGEDGPSNAIAGTAAAIERLHTALAAAHRRGIERIRKRLQRSNEQAAYWKGECGRRTAEVRYRLGDALVSAYFSPKDFLALPFRVIRLFGEGLARCRERRLMAADDRQPSATVTAGKVGSAPAAADPTPAAPAVNRTTTSRVTFTPVQRPQRDPRCPIKAAVIMDEFTTECFRDECHLLPITPDDWKDQITAEKPDFLFVESAWKGNQMAWHKLIEKCADPDNGQLVELVNDCKKKGIPTVFWNKEDPPNFRHFIFAASHFDTIFTTDELCIPRYREHVDHDRVYALPFAAQPTIHHPIGSSGDRPGTVCFAGTWYNQKHADRRADMEVLLRPSLQHGLHIYDRMHDFTLNDNYRFPGEYQSSIRGSLTYPEMIDAYKKYRVFLNVNSVKNSPTMFSRRVLELLACGTAVISNWSLAIEQLLGTDSVALVHTAEDTAEWLEALLSNTHLRDVMVLRGQRRIFAEHTYQLRLLQILERIGLSITTPQQDVAVVACATSIEQAHRILDNYERQSLAHKSLILALRGSNHSESAISQRLASLPNATCFAAEESRSIGECLNRAIAQSCATHISVFSPDAYYGRCFLTDLMLAFVYAEADVVCKAARFFYDSRSQKLAVRNPAREHGFTDWFPVDAMLARRQVFEKTGFPHVDDAGLEAFGRDCSTRGLKVYAGDRFNHAVINNDGQDSAEVDPVRTVAFTPDFVSYVDV